MNSIKSFEYNDKISSEKSVIETIIGIVKKLTTKVVFLYNSSNSLNWLLANSLEIAGANTLFRLMSKKVVIPVMVNKILYAAKLSEGNLRLIIKVKDWEDAKDIIE